MAHRTILAERQRAELFDLPSNDAALLRHYTLADDDCSRKYPVVVTKGLIMFAVARENADRKTLATVREYLTLPPEKFRALLERCRGAMAQAG